MLDMAASTLLLLLFLPAASYGLSFPLIQDPSPSGETVILTCSSNTEQALVVPVHGQDDQFGELHPVINC